jgi:hypothetical protein
MVRSGFHLPLRLRCRRMGSVSNILRRQKQAARNAPGEEVRNPRSSFRTSGLSAREGKNPCSEGTPVPSLVKAVARARDWYERIVSGEVNTIGQLVQKSGLTRRYVRRILPFANLSPQITEMILSGKHRADLTLQELLASIPSDWREQQDRILPPS